jgi:predicted amidophosphoribosyltransferase
VAELEYADGLKPSGFGHAGSNPVTGTCKDCQKEISRYAIRCKGCKAKLQPSKIVWPSNEELLKMLNASNYTQLAKTLGVSDNAIRKRLKNNDS